MSIINKKDIPVLLTAIFAVLMILNTFLNVPVLGSIAVESQRMLVPIVSTATLVGGTSLLIYNFRKINRKREGWQTSVVVVASFAYFFTTGLVPALKPLYDATYSVIVGRLYEATWALISLFMVSMAYRAFKVKNLETGLFAVSCILILFGNAPVGDAILPGASLVLNWLMDVPTMAVMRSITIGVALGVIAYGVRVILGFDRTALGEFGEESQQ